MALLAKMSPILLLGWSMNDEPVFCDTARRNNSSFSWDPAILLEQLCSLSPPLLSCQIRPKFKVPAWSNYLSALVECETYTRTERDSSPDFQLTKIKQDVATRLFANWNPTNMSAEVNRCFLSSTAMQVSKTLAREYKTTGIITRAAYWL